MPQGALVMLVLHVLQSETLHAHGIAQRILHRSDSVFDPEGESLHSTLQQMLADGWVSAGSVRTGAGRIVPVYTLTADGKQQLARQLADYEEVTTAIQAILRTT